MNRAERERQFVCVVRERRTGMYRVALSMLHVPADAEDAVSNAVEAAWKHLDRMRDVNALPGYLTRCAINSCHAMLRRRKREVTADKLPEVAATRDQSPLWEMVGNLPEKYRLPLVMRFGGDMSVKEIAWALRITRSGASSRIQRGLRVLRQQLGEEASNRE